MNQGSTDTVVKEKTKEARPPMGEVVCMNDDFTDVYFVIHVLMKVFRKNQEEAVQLTNAIHSSGRAKVGIFPLEIAETKVQLAHSMARSQGFPLQFDVIPVGGNQG